MGDFVEPAAHISRPVEATLDAGNLAADRNADAVVVRQDVEHAEVGDVIADEDRAAVALVKPVCLISTISFPGNSSIVLACRPAQTRAALSSTMRSLSGACR